MTVPQPDRRVVQCNYSEPAKVASKGARAYVARTNPGNGHDRILILARSRGGRWIEKWEDIRRLDYFRVKTLPPGHPRFDDHRLWDYEPEATAAALMDAAGRHRQ